MTIKSILSAVAAVAMLTGCCYTPGRVASVSCPVQVIDTTPCRMSGLCRPNVSRSWSASNSYNAPDRTTCISNY